MLTLQQKYFADYYLTSGNKREACRKAGYGKKSKNLEKYLASKSSQLMCNPEVKAYITNRLREKDGKILVSQDELLGYLSRCVRGEETETNLITFKDSYEKVEIPISQKNRIEASKLLFKFYKLDQGKNINKDEKPIINNDIEKNNMEEVEDFNNE